MVSERAPREETATSAAQAADVRPAKPTLADLRRVVVEERDARQRLRRVRTQRDELVRRLRDECALKWLPIARAIALATGEGSMARVAEVREKERVRQARHRRERRRHVGRQRQLGRAP